MAIWQDDKTGERHDDGATAKPGEESFTRDLAEQHFGHKDFSYVGTPNWVPSELPTEPRADSAVAAEAPVQAPQGDAQ